MRRNRIRALGSEENFCKKERTFNDCHGNLKTTARQPGENPPLRYPFPAHATPTSQGLSSRLYLFLRGFRLPLLRQGFW